VGEADAAIFRWTGRGLGERDEAFRWVERAYRERSNYVAYIAIDDSFDAVRTDRRYLNLLRRIGLE
jgi:hypothetical protein